VHLVGFIIGIKKTTRELYWSCSLCAINFVF